MYIVYQKSKKISVVSARDFVLIMHYNMVKLFKASFCIDFRWYDLHACFQLRQKRASSWDERCNPCFSSSKSSTYLLYHKFQTYIDWWMETNTFRGRPKQDDLQLHDWVRLEGKHSRVRHQASQQGSGISDRQNEENRRVVPQRKQLLK